MRKVVIAAGSAILVAVLAVLAVPLLINIDQRRTAIQAELQKKLNRPVTLGAVSLKIFPFSIRMEDVTIGDAPPFASRRPFISAKQVYAGAGLFSLLGKQIDINDLRLDQPHIEFIRDARGTWNFATMGHAGGTSEVSLRDLHISDGQIAVTDLSKHQRRTIYDHIDLRLSGYAPGKQFGVILSAHLPGAGKELLSLNGTAGPLRSGGSTPVPLNGHVTMKEVSLSDLQKLASGAAGQTVVDGIASGDADVRNEGSLFNVHGNAAFDKVTVRGAALADPVRADFHISEDFDRDLVTITQAAIKLGRTPVSVSGSFARAGQVDLSVKTSGAPVGDLLKIADAYGVSAAEGIAGSGTISIDVHVTGSTARSDALNWSGSAALTNASLKLPSLAKPLDIKTADVRFQQNSALIDNLLVSFAGGNVRGRMNIHHFASPQLQFDLAVDKLNVADLQHVAATAPQHQPRTFEKMSGSGTLSAGTLIDTGMVLTNVHANCVLDHGVIRLSPFTADLFGGRENGTITIDTRPARPVYGLNVKVEHVDAQRLLSAATSLKQVLFGLLAANGNATFVSAPDGNIAPSLNGDLTLNITDGKLMNVNVLNELAAVGNFLGAARQTQPFTSMKQLAGNISIRNGIARTDNLHALLDTGSLAAAGTVNLMNQSLDLHVTAVLARGFSQIAGGTQVGGYLRTVLANNNNELVLPVLVTGTVAKPHFAPDVGRLAQMRLQNLLPTAGNPGQLTSGILGSVLGGKGGKNGVQGILDSLGGQNGAAPQQGENALGGLIDALTKKKSNPK